ncbi:MAG: phosphoribosyltransferase family protein [Anaerolineae bacterium]|nr:phosphoribosyltransferase family protein [Thermoflexales bacterium]MDW8396605.1 phosphoribosyltransferase family protein [Anaerolineae bacterium]
MEEVEFYPVNVAGVERRLPLMEVAPGVRIAVLNILGDNELVQAAARALAPKLPPETEYLVTAETKSIPLVYALSVESNLPYIVLRKSYKPYMGEAISAETLSITTNKPQTLYLDAKDRHAIQGKRVVLIDDVISTGSTLQGMRLIMQKANAQVIAEAAIFTEGDRARWSNVIALGHLPVFTSNTSS